MADPKARGIEVTRLCRNKPLTEAQRCSIISLLKDGADLNVRYGPGNTALHYAADKGHAEIVKELLLKGADPCCTNDDGKTPTDLARAVGNSDVAKVLDAASSKKKAKPVAAPQSSSPSNPQSSSPSNPQSSSPSNPQSSSPSNPQSSSPSQDDQAVADTAAAAEALRASSLSGPELPAQAVAQPQAFSAAERQAIETMLTKTLSSPLPPGVTSIGYILLSPLRRHLSPFFSIFSPFLSCSLLLSPSHSFSLFSSATSATATLCFNFPTALCMSQT